MPNGEGSAIGDFFSFHSAFLAGDKHESESSAGVYAGGVIGRHRDHRRAGGVAAASGAGGSGGVAAD
jgi:hypothetical protein